MKKVVMLILAVIMAAAVFSGCTNNSGDWDYILKQGKIIVGFDPHFPPMGFYEDMGSTDADEAIGFDIDVAKEMAEILGVNVEFKSIDWGKKESELKSRNIDLIWNGYTMTETRAANHLFSIPYMKNTQVAVIKVTDADKYTDKQSLEGAVIGYQTNSSAQDVVKADDLLKNNSQVSSKDYGLALTELENNTDCLIMDSVAAGYYINLGGGSSKFMIIENLSFGDEVYGIGIRQGASLTLYKINNALLKMRDDGTLNTIAAKYNLESELLLIRTAV